MSGRRGILLQIEGCLTGFSSSETAIALTGATWATSIVEAIRSIPNSQSMSVDPFSGDFSNGGTDIELTKEAGILLVRSTVPLTTLKSNISKTDLSASVTDTVNFPAGGTIWVDAEAMIYAGKTPTPTATFAPLVRGALGTIVTSHDAFVGTAQVQNKVYGFNPNIIGRIATISWYDIDLGAPMTPSRRYYGVVDDFEFGANAFTLRLISNAKQFVDAEALTKRYASGVFRGAYFKGYRNPLRGLPSKEEKGASSTNSIVIDVDDKDIPFPTSVTLGIPWKAMHYRIGDELFCYSRDLTPSGTVGPAGYIGTDANYGRFFTTNGFFLQSDIIRWAAPSSIAYTYAQITRVVSAPSASGDSLQIYHNADSAPTAGDIVTAPGRQQFSPLLRGIAGSPQTSHNIGDAVKEVRSLHGNMVVVALRLMLSLDGNNSIYDSLPTGWGAGIDEAFVDLPAFEALIPETPTNTYYFEEAVQIKTLLLNIARLTGARVYVDTSGVLTARYERDLWPDSVSIATVDTDLLEKDSIPVWHPQMSNVFNAWSFRGNARKGSDYLDEAHFEEPISVARYGRRPLEDYEDRHLTLSRDASTLEVLAYTVMQRWSTPNPIIDITILNTDTLAPWEPGQIVYLSLPHLPNMAGGSDITSMAEVLEWSPRDVSVTADVRVALMPATLDVRLISPAAEVQGIAGSVLTMHPASYTHLADPLGKTGIASVMPRAGTEDTDYFEENLTIQIIDRSTPSNKHSTTISAINYGTQQITVASLPGWTIAAGDIVRLDVYATTAAYSADFAATYLWMANDITSLLGTVTAHVWGR